MAEKAWATTNQLLAHEKPTLDEREAQAPFFSPSRITEMAGRSWGRFAWMELQSDNIKPGAPRVAQSELNGVSDEVPRKPLV